jgi:small subunit ribosomal protein S20
VPNIKSAEKRVQIAERNRVKNKNYSSAVKTLVKKFMSAVDKYAAAPSDEGMKDVQVSLSAATSKIDKAVKTGVLHRNNAARKKSNLAKAVRQATAK